MKYMSIYTTYEEFIKDLLSHGFTWNEVEYYWRNPEEFEKLCEEMENQNQMTSEEEAYWDYINNI